MYIAIIIIIVCLIILVPINETLRAKPSLKAPPKPVSSVTTVGPPLVAQAQVINPPKNHLAIDGDLVYLDAKNGVQIIDANYGGSDRTNIIKKLCDNKKGCAFVALPDNFMGQYFDTWVVGNLGPGDPKPNEVKNLKIKWNGDFAINYKPSSLKAVNNAWYNRF